MLADNTMKPELTLAKKKRGRPATGKKKVIYYRRVEPEIAEMLDRKLKDTCENDFKAMQEFIEKQDVITRVGGQNAVMVKETASAGIPQQAQQVKLLLDDVDRLSLEVADLKARREAYLRATDDDKTKFWRDRALRCEQMNKKGEFDQT